MRGNHRPVLEPSHHQGSIPACAGEPTRLAATSVQCAVYPRVCGGTWPDVLEIRTDTGLSPRVRGNLLGEQVAPCKIRSIPTCAGEPSLRTAGRPPTSVYPRVCGGTPLASAPAYLRQGLSPRVRGNRRRLAPPGPYRRSIPACAGEPSLLASTSKVRQVYPRVCGGTYVNAPIESPWYGLSPRVRGNRCVHVVGGRVVRSIPACAGEPT